MNEKQINKKSERLVWSGIILILVAALAVTYTGQFSSAINALVWMLWLMITLGLSSFTGYGIKVFEFGKEAQNELKKVTWPTRQETLQTTSIVIVVVAITGFFLWGVDSGMMWIIGKITHLG
jgi:preprotein translocase subunit SecE